MLRWFSSTLSLPVGIEASFLAVLISSASRNVSLIQNLLQDQEVYTAKQNTTPQAEDRGLARREEVFIKEFFIF
jgi:hypothetical protein